MREQTTWNKLLVEAAGGDVIIAKAPESEAVWETQFDPGYGGSRGAPVLAWSETRVYFPVVYDGAEWLDSAPRNPQAEGQGHVGGE